jgi:hypothetical protein
VRDSVAGVGLFEYPPTTGSSGVLKLVNGKGVTYDKDAKGTKTRTLTVTARRKITGTTSYIKTRKACTVTVTVTNSNDRPWIEKNQERSIEENSAIETLVQTPVAANDYDDGQSFEYELVKTMDKNGVEITDKAKAVLHWQVFRHLQGRKRCAALPNKQQVHDDAESGRRRQGR